MISTVIKLKLLSEISARFPHPSPIAPVSKSVMTL